MDPRIRSGADICPRRWKDGHVGKGRTGTQEHACIEHRDHVKEGAPHRCGGCKSTHPIDGEDRK